MALHFDGGLARVRGPSRRLPVPTGNHYYSTVCAKVQWRRLQWRLQGLRGLRGLPLFTWRQCAGGAVQGKAAACGGLWAACELGSQDALQ